MAWHWAARVLFVVGAVGAVIFLLWRHKKTPEQIDLANYVERTLPWLRSREAPVEAEIAKLSGKGAPGPEAARKMLVDEIIPSLLKLKKEATNFHPETKDVEELHLRYVAVTDRLIDACRACVRVIDDPKLSTADGVKTIRDEFAAVRTAYASWDTDLDALCKRHHIRLKTAPSAPAPSPQPAH
jgi:hypothetical protein